MRQINTTKLKELRKKAGLTQEDIAKKLGYKTSLGYHYIETGRCRMKADQAFVLAELFNVAVDELFFTEEITAKVIRDLPKPNTA